MIGSRMDWTISGVGGAEQSVTGMSEIESENSGIYQCTH